MGTEESSHSVDTELIRTVFFNVSVSECDRPYPNHSICFRTSDGDIILDCNLVQLANLAKQCNTALHDFIGTKPPRTEVRPCWWDETAPTPEQVAQHEQLVSLMNEFYALTDGT